MGATLMQLSSIWMADPPAALKGMQMQRNILADKSQVGSTVLSVPTQEKKFYNKSIESLISYHKLN